MVFWTRLGVFEELGHPPGSHPAPPFAAPSSVWSEPKQDTRVCLMEVIHSWGRLLNLHYFCLSVLQVSTGKACVSESACERACGHVWFPSLVSISSGALPEQIAEGQWVSWNSCGRKPSNYAIRFGYVTIVSACVCLCWCVCVCTQHVCHCLFTASCDAHSWDSDALGIQLLYQLPQFLVQKLDSKNESVNAGYCCCDCWWSPISLNNVVALLKLFFCCRMPGKPAMIPLCHR